MGGEIEDDNIRTKLIDFLEKENGKINAYAETNESNCSWDTYEPTLARHLSKSTLRYYERVLANDEGIMKNIDSIQKHLKALKQ